MEGRQQPYDFEAEQALLGCILLDDRIMQDVMQMITYTDFYRPTYGVIYAEMERMATEGKRIDALTLRDSLGKEQTARLGGEPYLIELSGAAPTSVNWKSYASIVRRDGLYRKLIEAGVDITAMGYDADEDVESCLAEAASIVNALALQTNSDTLTASTAIARLLEEMKMGTQRKYRVPYLPWVNAKPGDLIVVAAGQSVGKTAVALNWGDEWSKENDVVYFEYEMSESDLMARLICKYAGVSFEQIQEGTLTDEEKQRIEDAAKEVAKRTLRVQEVWCPIATLMAKIRKEAQRGAEIVVIDHLGLIPFSHQHKGANFAKQVGLEITNPLKRLASELQIVIVILVQLNREGQRDGHFPKPFHLRDSGEIEQDASIIVMVWSERQIADDPGKQYEIREKSGILTSDEMFSQDFLLTRLGVEKNRNGRLGEKFLLYKGEHFAYEDRESAIPLFNPPAETLFKETDAVWTSRSTSQES